MKQSFLSKFSRSAGCAPEGWPAEDSIEIYASAVEMKRITADLIKKILICIPTAMVTASHAENSKNNTGFNAFIESSGLLRASSMKMANKNENAHAAPFDLGKNASEQPLKYSIMEMSMTEQLNSLKLNCPKNGIERNEYGTSLNSNVCCKLLSDKIQETKDENGEQKYQSNGNQTHFKKVPESILARTCLEASERLANLQPTLSHLLFGCGQAARHLACARLTWGTRVHESVMDPLRRVAEATAPNGELLKSRRQAWRAGGELRSVSERAARATAAAVGDTGDCGDQFPLGSSEAPPCDWLSPITSTQQYQSCDKPPTDNLTSSFTNSHNANLKLAMQMKNVQAGLTSPPTQGINSLSDDDRAQKWLLRKAKATQLNAIKEDLETETRGLKEKALRELYRFEIMSTMECAKALLEFVELSANYHRTCASILDELSPMLREELYEQCPLPVFGRRLEMHLQATGRRIAYPLSVCIRALDLPNVLVEEGLFRIAGSKKKVDTLQSALNTMRAERIIGQYDPYVIADALKQYLRSLPDPLLTRELYEEWTAARHRSSLQEQLEHLYRTIARMPKASQDNAAFLFRFLERLATHSDKNRMTSSNLGIILGPTLLAPFTTPNDDTECEVERAFWQCAAPVSMDPQANSSESFSQNGISASLANAGTRGGVIELLITNASQLFSDVEDDACETDAPDAIFECLNVQSKSIEANAPDKKRGSEDNTLESKECIARLHSSSSELSKRAQRCMNEFTNKQGRALRSLPQRLKAKHAKGLPTLQTIFGGRPQSAQTKVKPFTSLLTTPEESPVVMRPSRVPVSGIPFPKDQLPGNNVIGISLTDSSIDRSNSLECDATYALSKGATDYPPSSPTESANEEKWLNNPRYGFYEDSLSLNSQLVLEEPETEVGIEEEGGGGLESLKNMHERQEWLRLMLLEEATDESTPPLPGRFFHGDLYDTVFALQSLMNVTGLENLMSRVRSVYETHRCAQTPSAGGSQVPHPTTVTQREIEQRWTNVKSAAAPRSDGHCTTYGVRRHSTSSLASTELRETGLPRPINPHVQRHYKKSMTSPSNSKTQRNSMLRSPPESRKRPVSSVGRSKTLDGCQVSTPMQKFSTRQPNNQFRSSFVARIPGHFSGYNADYDDISDLGDGQIFYAPNSSSSSTRFNSTLPRTAATPKTADSVSTLTMPKSTTVINVLSNPTRSTAADSYQHDSSQLG